MTQTITCECGEQVELQENVVRVTLPCPACGRELQVSAPAAEKPSAAKRGLWALMGKPAAAEEPAPATGPTDDQAVETSPAETADTTPAPEPPAATASSESRGRGLWSMMRPAGGPAKSRVPPEPAPEAKAAPEPESEPEVAATGPEQDPFDDEPVAAQPEQPPASPTRPRMAGGPLARSPFPSMNKGRGPKPEEAKSEPEPTGDLPVPVFAGDEAELSDEPDAMAPLALPAAPSMAVTRLRERAPAASGTRLAFWSLVSGIAALLLSVLAIWPNFWSRLPSSAAGFAALLTGLLAQGELQKQGRGKAGLAIAVSGISCGVIGMFAGPLIWTPLDVYGRWCRHVTAQHLDQLSLATQSYLAENGAFPPGGTFRPIKNEPSLPLHGWMTHLLPHLPDGAPLAARIDWTKPYDVAPNAEVMALTIPDFQAAGGPTALIRNRFAPTHYAGVGGIVSLPDGTMAHAGVFDENSAVTRERIRDGQSQTMIVGEIGAEYPPWGDPRNWRQIGKGLNKSAQGFGSAQGTGAMFLMADGSVRYFTNQTDLKVLRALSTRDGEEPLDADDAGK